MGSQGFTLTILRLQEAWGLHDHGHQVLNIFRLVGVLASMKQLRKCASDTVSTSERSYSRGRGGGVCPGKDPEALLGYTKSKQDQTRETSVHTRSLHTRAHIDTDTHTQ